MRRWQGNAAKTLEQIPVIRYRAARPIRHRYDEIDGILPNKVQNDRNKGCCILGRVGILKTDTAILREGCRGEHALHEANGDPMSASPQRSGEGQGGGTVTV